MRARGNPSYGADTWLLRLPGVRGRGVAPRDAQAGSRAIPDSQAFSAGGSRSILLS